MKKLSLALIIFLIWTTFGLWLYSWIIPVQTVASNAVVTSNEIPTIKKEIDTSLINKELDAAPIETSLIKEETANISGLIARTVSSDLIFNFDEGFSFKKDSIGFVIPKALVDYKYKLSTYLVDHPDLELHILSTYSPAERLESPNMGVQRGNLIVNELEKIGIHKHKMVIEPIIDDIDFNEQGIYTNGVAFQFKPLDENRILTIAPEVVNIPEKITFYPKFSDTGILHSDKLDALLTTVKTVMEHYPTIKLKIVGHTDNVANASINYKMGLKYAEELRWYLKAKGTISSKRFSAISRGEVRPIRSNETASGRRANRRVELQFIK